MQEAMPFWKSRIFWVCLAVIASLTILLAIHAVTLAPEAVIGVYASVIAAAAGLSRRGDQLQPVVQGGPLVDPQAAAIIASAIPQLASALMGRYGGDTAEPAPPEPEAHRPPADPDEIPDEVPSRAEEVPS